MRRLGDEAWLIDVDGQDDARRVAGELGADAEAVPGAASVGVLESPGASTLAARPDGPVLHEIPVAFDGADLEVLGLTPVEVAALLASAELEVAFLGFMPGFAYLCGLPEPLASLPRRPTPRPRVPAGSFAVGGGYAGIYPSSSPGGWHLLGRSPLRCFDHRAAPYARLWPGDHVRIVPTAPFPPAVGEKRAPLRGDGIEVVDPGLLLLVEDLGRRGAAALGVPRAGAANELALRIANRAVGNEEGAAGLEITGTARLRAGGDLLVAAAGGRLVVEDVETSPGMVTAVGSGQLVTVSGHRAILACSGGLATEVLFGSRSADAVSGLPPGPLRSGDGLPLGRRPARARARLELPPVEKVPVLRALAGPDEVGPAALAALTSARLTVETDSDRTGLRCRVEASFPALSSVPSHLVVPGAIQLPPDGRPVVLGPDCGPVGGYPVAATVISADRWRLGTLRPGDCFELLLVSLETARAARASLEEVVERSLTGWFPTHLG